MKLFQRCKDGGPESRVTAYFLCEFKRAFSVALLRFDSGTRAAYHSHAFDSVSWVLSGWLVEHFLNMRTPKIHYPSWRAIVTRRSTTHQVVSVGRTWVFTLRGPWVSTWHEFVSGRKVTLTHGRKELR